MLGVNGLPPGPALVSSAADFCPLEIAKFRNKHSFRVPAVRLAIALGLLLGVGHGWVASVQRLHSGNRGPESGLQSVRPSLATFPY